MSSRREIIHTPKSLRHDMDYNIEPFFCAKKRNPQIMTNPNSKLFVFKESRFTYCSCCLYKVESKPV